MKVAFQGGKLHVAGPKAGMLMDYYDIGLVCKALVENRLDHTHLNDLLANPTSENLSAWCFRQIREALPEEYRELLHSVEIGETCTTGCVYHG
jgi:6-pyruvoyl-tetrahydropterin synthase